MSNPPADRDTHVGPAFPGVAGIADAFRFIARGTPQVGAWAVYLPVVGMVVGALWVLADLLVEPLAGRVAASIVVLLVGAAVTRARPLVALSRVLAALPARRERRLAALEGSDGVTYVVCLLIVVAAELAVLSMLARFRLVGLAFGPVLGCCAMVVLAVGSRAARADGRRLKFAPEVGFREFGVASTATFALVFLTTEFLGLLLVLATAAVTIAARVFFHRWIDGVNQTVILAVGEAVQLLILTLLLMLS